MVSNRSEGSGASSATYGWDDVNRLTSQSDVFQLNANNVAWTFAYNPASQIVTETRSNDAYGFAKATASTTYAVNGLNQYTAVGGTAHSYDANGNLTGTGAATYTYDIENRLVKAVAGATTTNLVYDPLGRLFEVNQGSSATTTRFLNDGDAMVAELNSSNFITNRFVHGSNAAADDPLVWYLGSTMTIRRWLHGDHLGSVVAVTNSSGGSPSINRYDEYGVPAGTNIGRFQYTGQAWIGELGLYYYKARFYSPGLGRFLQTDPIGYEGGINLYGYVEGDPINEADPDGEQRECTGSNIDNCDGLASGRSGHTSDSITGRVERVAEAVGQAAKRASDTISPENVVSHVISLATLGEYSPDQIRSDIDKFFENPVSNAAEVLAAFPGTRGLSAGTSLWTSGRLGSAAANAFSHFKSHGAQFGARSAVGYVREAHRFFRSPPAGTLTRVRSNGDILRYHPRSNTFGAFKSDGTPKTFFKPKQGIDYWNRIK